MNICVTIEFVRRKVVKHRHDKYCKVANLPGSWYGREVIVMPVEEFEKLIRYVEDLERRVQELERKYSELLSLWREGVLKYIQTVIGGSRG